MNAMKKLFALLLALALVMSLAVPAMAADGYTITITDKFDGHTYEAYQIFDGDYADGILSSIKWGASFNTANVKQFVEQLQNDKAFGEGSANVFASIVVTDGLDQTALNAIAAEIAGKMVSWQRDDDMIKEFAKVLHTSATDAGGNITYSYLKTPVASSVQTNAEANADGNFIYTISNLPAGYYMVKDKDGSQNDQYDYYTRVILHVAGDISIAPKGGVPSVDKKVHNHIDGTFEESEDVSITDTFYFKLTGTMPANLEQYSEYTYEFVDTMDGQLMFSPDTYTGYEAVPGIASIYVERVGSGGETPIVPLTLTRTAADANNTDKRHNLLVAFPGEATTDATDVVISMDQTTGVLSVKFLNLRESLPGLVSSDKIIIKYAAKFNPAQGKPDIVYGNGSSATTETGGNVNKVYVNFSNNPQGDGMGKTPEAESEVYTYQLNVEKTNDLEGTAQVKLPGAEFMLYQRILDANDNVTYKYAVFQKNGDSYMIKDWITLPQGVKIIKDTKEDTDNPDVNYALKADGTKIKDASGNGLDKVGNVVAGGEGIVIDSLVAVTGTNGQLNIKGLNAVTYYLQELRAPATYNKLTNDINITFNATHSAEGPLTSLSVTANGKDAATNIGAGSGDVSITNSKGAVLPSTGGIGTTIFYVAGGLLVVAAITLLITKKRMSEK